MELFPFRPAEIGKDVGGVLGSNVSPLGVKQEVAHSHNKNPEKHLERILLL